MKHPPQSIAQPRYSDGYSKKTMDDVGIERSNETEPVVIVGGGISGLLCFYRLVRQGIPCHLFEAGPFFGGRFASVFRTPLSERFTVLRSHTALLRLCQELNVRLSPSSSSSGPPPGGYVPTLHASKPTHPGNVDPTKILRFGLESQGCPPPPSPGGSTPVSASVSDANDFVQTNGVSVSGGGGAGDLSLPPSRSSEAQMLHLHPPAQLYPQPEHYLHQNQYEAACMDFNLETTLSALLQVSETQHRVGCGPRRLGPAPNAASNLSLPPVASGPQPVPTTTVAAAAAFGVPMWPRNSAETLSARALLSPDLGPLQDGWAFDSKGPFLDLVRNAEANAALQQIHLRRECSRTGPALQFGCAGEFIRKILTVPHSMQDLYRNSTVSVNSKVTDINVDVKSGYTVTLASGTIVRASSVVLASPIPENSFSVLLGTDLDPNLSGSNPVSVAEVFVQLTFASPQLEKATRGARYVLPPPLRWFQHLKRNGFCAGSCSGPEADQLLSLHRSGNLTFFVQMELSRFFGPGAVTICNCDLYFWKGAKHFWKPGVSPDFSIHAGTGLFFCGESVSSPWTQGWLEGAVQTAEAAAEAVTWYWYGDRDSSSSPSATGHQGMGGYVGRELPRNPQSSFEQYGGGTFPPVANLLPSSAAVPFGGGHGARVPPGSGVGGGVGSGAGPLSGVGDGTFPPPRKLPVWNREVFVHELKRKGGLLTLPAKEQCGSLPGYIFVHRHIIDVHWLIRHWPRNLLPDRLFRVQKLLIPPHVPTSDNILDALDMTNDFRPVQIHGNDFGWLLRNAVAILGY